MVLGNNVKNLVIIIPSEGHHGANEENESKVPRAAVCTETTVINSRTTVSWFNGDEDHERTVNVKNTNEGSLLFSTCEITDTQVSKTITFNSTENYNYEADDDHGVTMRVAVTVGNIQSRVTNSVNGEIDTVGVLMVPTQDKITFIKDVENGGLTVDSTYDFSDLRGGQQGTGDIQTLIVSTSVVKDLNSVVSPLSEISSTLPYI